MIGRSIMWCSRCLLAVILLGCSAAGERPRTRSPVRLPPEVLARGLRESNEVEITVRGTYPDLTFHFVDCTTGRPSAWITEISIVRENRIVCEVEAADESLPPVWKYGTLGREPVEKCEALAPGLYGIDVYGGEKGRAEFEIAESGTVSVKGLSCQTTGKSSN